jgi:hypothetical protein
MKSTCIFTMIAALVLMSAGCDSPSKFLDKSAAGKESNTTPLEFGSAKGIKFIVFVNNAPLKGAVLTVDGVQGTTNDKGEVWLKGPKGKGEEQEVIVVHEKLDIQTTRMLRIFNPTEIHLSPTIGNMDVLGGAVKGYKEETRTIEERLNDAEALLNGIEHELDEYVKKHKKTEVDEHYPIVAARRAELVELREMVKDINVRFAQVIKELEADKIVDISEHSAMMNRLRNSANAFQDRVDKTAYAVDGNIGAKPDATLSMDIFFEEGEYKLGNLTPDQRDSLNAYCQKFFDLKEGRYAHTDYNQLVTKLVAYGYTDGVPVGISLQVEIGALCKGKLSYNDPNDCLSHLRAEEIAEYISAKIKDFKPTVEVHGEGSVLAKGKTNENPAFRKCQLSFFVAYKSTMTGASESTTSAVRSK